MPMSPRGVSAPTPAQSGHRQATPAVIGSGANHRPAGDRDLTEQVGARLPLPQRQAGPDGASGASEPSQRTCIPAAPRV